MIVHVDMDAFYAAVEQRDQPELRGKPVVVGGSPSGRGVVMAASYEARRHGIRSAMPAREALQRCPEIIFVRGRHSHYADVGRRVREIFHQFTPLVQPLSLDEAFLDVSGVTRLFGSATTIGRRIKQQIQTELDLTASVGVAPLKFVAKIASDLNKPDGFVIVGPDEVQRFLDPLPVARLWGVGRVGQQRLDRLGFRTIAQLRVCPVETLRAQFGGWGEHLWRLANGIDARRVVTDHCAKQISHERTFAHDLTDAAELNAVVSYLSEQVGRRVRRSQRTAKTVTLKYRRDDFRTFVRSCTLPRPTASTREIFHCAADLLEQLRRAQPRPVRLIGVAAGSLTARDAPRQLTLFDLSEHQTADRKVDDVMDRLSDTNGRLSVYRATSHSWISEQSS